MNELSQGEIIKIPHASTPFLVVSQDYFNVSGLIVVCPVVTDTFPDALHIPVNTDALKGYVLCENITTVSSKDRGFSRIGRISGAELLEIIYRVQSIFDYYNHAE